MRRLNRNALRRLGVGAFLVAPPVCVTAWVLVDVFRSAHQALAALFVAAIVVWLVAFNRVVGPSSRPALASRLAGARTLRAAARGLERDEFELHYQPQIDLRSGRPYGVEALARWRRGGELLGPAAFLPAIEESELIGPLTIDVLDKALGQAAAWQLAGSPLSVAVNLSAANLRDFAIVPEIERLLGKHGVRPELVTFEVTETTVLEDPQRTRAVLDAISALGVALAVDDFGIGHSSLLRLSIFPVDEIKIDRSFVSRLPDEGRAFVEGVIRLAEDLSLRVVAEGVEDEAALEELQALGCGAAQGFLFSQPLAPERIPPWFAARGSTDWARHEVTMSILPDFDRIADVRRLVEEHGSDLGIGEKDLLDLRVATTEGVANAIEHGDRAPDGLIHFRVAEVRGELVVEISGGGREQGAQARPRRHPGGSGMMLMNETMDDVRLSHGRDGSLIRMTKVLPGRAPPG